MTKEQFDQFRNKILALSGDTEVFWEEFKTLQTTKEKAIHLLREKNYQLEVRNEELQKAKNEVKNFKSHLQEALKKIKQLEREKPQTIPSQLNIKEEPTDIVDLRKIANDFDVRLAQRKEEKTLHYLQEW
ncbi:MAG: hypothetical protein O3A78_12695 [Nitrospinae bacterium]|jgi:chromosome segregation ATPase|nr:hypothetical protein [Nitrospinota bacterium]MDA1110646.1 hypothetical protein [Nitrospinota bacterium]